MKPITREDCELMWVWDGDFDSGDVEKFKYLVVAVFDDGSCIAIDPSRKFCALYFNEYDHCAPIEKAKVKKWVPCECREDLPEGFVNGWLRDKHDDTRRMVGSWWTERDGRILDCTYARMFDRYEWSPTFDGPYQPIGKLVEVEGE